MTDLGFKDPGEAPAPCAEYNQLLKRVQEGTLRVTFIVGVPRGGTTAFLHFLFEGLGQDFDCNVLQPGLVTRTEGHKNCRQASVWGYVLKSVLEAEQRALGEGRNLTACPLCCVVKDTSNAVMPDRAEVMRWQALSHALMVVVRNPVLQVESRILCIGDRILSGVLGSFGLDANLDPRTCTLHGKPLVRPGTDFSHVDFEDPAKGTAWQQHYSWMRSRRDFSSLDAGYIDLCGLHPLSEDPAVQRNMWGWYAAKYPASVPGGLLGAMADIERWEGTRLEGFGQLPEWTQQAMCQWHFGWIANTAHLEMLRGCRNVHIVDFTEAQAAPAAMGERCNELIFGGLEPFRACAGAGFYEEDRGPEWAAWYDHCFANHQGATAELTPPKKCPMRLENLPVFLREQMPDFVRQYLDARLDPRRLAVGQEALRKFRGVDPVFDALASFDTDGPDAAEAILRECALGS